MRTIAILLTLAAVTACRQGPSITDGAETADAWQKRLIAEVPIGMSSDSAKALLERNGFACNVARVESDNSQHLMCRKSPSGLMSDREQRWVAALDLDDKGRVETIRSNAGKGTSTK